MVSISSKILRTTAASASLMTSRRFSTSKPSDDGWAELLDLFPEFVGARNVFDMSVEMAQTSCGFGVPLMDFRADRDTMTDWLVKKGDDGLREYERRNNLVSLDGLPTGLPVA